MIIKYDYIHKFEQVYYKIKTQLWYRLFFKNIGKKSIIMKPLRINNPENIELRNNVVVYGHTWLLTLNVSDKIPNLILDDGATIGHYNHITCINDVYIGKNVLTADKVYISDNYHGYEDIGMPIRLQEVKSKGSVYIGENTWIGENVSIISASIGKHCIIGSNSVVNKDIPDYCIAVGAPAKIVKRYNYKTKLWEKTDSSGEFI